MQKRNKLFSDFPASARNKRFILVSKNAHLISCQPTKSSKLNFRASHLISWHSLQNNSNNKVLEQVLFFKTRQGCHCFCELSNLTNSEKYSFLGRGPPQKMKKWHSFPFSILSIHKKKLKTVLWTKKRLFVW